MGVKALWKRHVVTILVLMFLASLMAVMKVSEVEAIVDLRCKWRWSASTTFQNHVQVVTTPIVAPLYDDNGDTSYDEQDNPYIVFSCFQTDYWRQGTIRVVDKTGSEVSAFNPPNPSGPDAVSAYGQIAVADICDNSGVGGPDKIPEILAIRENGGGIICFNNLGVRLKRNTRVVPMFGAITVSDIAEPGGTGSPDGIPEVIVGNEVFENDLDPLWTGSLVSNGFGISVVADLTMDGDPEVIVGNTAYQNDGTPFWDMRPFTFDGYVAVADLIGEARTGVLFPEVVLVCPGQVVAGWHGRVYLLDDVESGTPSIAWARNIPGGDAADADGVWNGGPPTLGDFDGDGAPEIGVAGYNRYTFFDSNGRLIRAFGIDDSTSGLCGSSAFDFDGDGIDEIAYRDQDCLYVFNALVSLPLDLIDCSSFTGAELPTIADVDKDCHAEIVVSADNVDHGSEWGVYVYENYDDDWSRTRCLWNQHAYSITNVESDTSVPQDEKNNWEHFNNFRCQHSTGLGSCIVAVGSERTGMFEGSISVFDFYGNCRWDLWTDFPVVSVAMDNDGRFIAAGTRGSGTSGRLYLFDQTRPASWIKQLPISTSYDDFEDGTESKSVDVKYSRHNGMVVVAAATDDGLYLFRQNGAPIWCYPYRQTIVRISQDGNYIVCADYVTGRVHYFSHMKNGRVGWQPNDDKPMWTWYWGPHWHLAFWVAISSRGEYVAVSTLGPDAVVLIQGWDGAVVWIREVEKGGLGECGVRVDMQCYWGRVVSVNDDKFSNYGYELLVWDHRKDTQNGWQPTDEDWKCRFVPSSSSQDDFYSVSISGDGKVAAAGGHNPGVSGTEGVFIYDVEPPCDFIRQVPLGNEWIQSIDLTSTGKYGVAGDKGGKVWFFSKQSDDYVWCAETGVAVHSVAISKSEPCFMEYPPKRLEGWPFEEIVIGCFQGDGDCAVMGYKASQQSTVPRWEEVAAWTIHNITGTRDRASPTAADLDNDGDYDLLISNAIDVPPMGYRNVGNRTHPVWQRCTAWDVPSLGSYEQNPDLADLDNDGDPDLCVAGPHYAAFFENNGTVESPSWKRKPEWDFDPLVHWPSPSFSDIDSDGDYDLMFAAHNESCCVAWENNGTAEDPSWIRKPDWNATGLPANHNKHLDLVDLDSDGDYDLMVGIGNPARNISAFMNTGTPMSPRWTRNPTWDISLPNMTWIRPAFANLDGVHDITVHDLTTSKIVAGQGYPVHINVTIVNEGDHTEKLNTTIYANTRIIQTETITLQGRSSTTVTFTWNTACLAKGNYPITAKATPVPGETYTADNTFADGIITVTIPGDVDGDWDVDLYDVVKICAVYGSKKGDPEYVSNRDINCDGKINIYDVVIACTHYGQKDP